MAKHLGMEDFFGLLDKWRHFPAFPLEPRSETLFALFLPMVLRECKSVGVKVKPQIIPQFPLKHDKSNQSDKVDFFALSEDGQPEDGQRGFLIELKTDMRSVRLGQEKYLTKAMQKSMDEILHGYKEIAKSSTDKKYARQKYFYMSHVLAELGLIKLPRKLEDTIYPSNSRGVSISKVDKLINMICIPKLPFKPEVVYIQPKHGKEIEGFKYIYFEDFAKSVESQGDLGEMFAGYLRKWIEDPANQPPSEDLNR